MQTIVVASQKGGAGKTTLAANLAVIASKTSSALLIDTDPQKTLKTWWEQREAEQPTLAESSIESLPKMLSDLGETFQLAIIDTPPAITDSIEAVIKMADLVLIPVRPSPADLWAVGDTLALCRKQDRKYAFVITQAIRGSSLTLQAVAALSEHGPVCGAIIHHRVAYAGAFATGLAVQEFEPRSPGAGEIRDVLAFVLARMQDRMIVKKKALVHES